MRKGSRKVSVKMNQVVPAASGTEPSSSLNSNSVRTSKTALSMLEAREPPRRSTGANSALSQITGTRSQHIIDSEYQEKLDIKKISEERKEYLFQIRPSRTKNRSGWTKNGYFPSKVPDCPAGMESMVEMGFFFIAKAGKHIDEVYDPVEQDLGDSKYQIFGSDGKVQYYALETLEANNDYPSRVKDIDFTVTGPKGGVVLNMKGSTKRAVVSNEDGKLGSIVRVGLRPYFKPGGPFWNYSVNDEKGNEICRFMKRDRKIKYKIYLPGVTASVAELKQTWDQSSYILPEPGTQDSLGLHLYDYTTKFSTKNKTLILAATVLLYHNIFGPSDKFGENKERFKYGLIFNGAVGAICVILLIVIGIVFLIGKLQHSKNLNHYPSTCLK